MIVIKVELWSAITKEVKPLACAVIANKGTSRNPKRGDYNIWVSRKGSFGDFKKTMDNPIRTGEIHNYPRLSYNVWRLVIRCLKEAFPEEK